MKKFLSLLIILHGLTVSGFVYGAARLEEGDARNSEVSYEIEVIEVVGGDKKMQIKLSDTVGEIRQKLQDLLGYEFHTIIYMTYIPGIRGISHIPLNDDSKSLVDFEIPAHESMYACIGVTPKYIQE